MDHLTRCNSLRTVPYATDYPLECIGILPRIRLARHDIVEKFPLPFSIKGFLGFQATVNDNIAIPMQPVGN
jgi:hypothetical protein